VIVVFDPMETNFEGNGVAALCPVSGTVRQVAGGEYSFSMKHPIDPWGKWTHLKREAVVRLPIPRETIKSAFSGVEADVYVTTGDTPLMDGMIEPSTHFYAYWNSLTVYQVGNRCSYGDPLKNYKCIFYDPASWQTQVPPNNSPWWVEISSTTTGSATLVTLAAGTELYLVEAIDDTWLQVMTAMNVVGYVKRANVSFLEHRTPTSYPPRIIEEQLFRIKDVSIDRKAHEVTVSGLHVSNDLNGNLIEDVSVTQASPGMALMRVMDGLLMDYPGQVATNLSSENTFTGSFKGKNGMYALLDPDSGIVPAFDAEIRRDNWDLFIMARENRDTGYRITYGSNVNGINWRTKTDKLITRIMPVAKDEGGNDLYLAEKWVDSEHIDEYPVPYMETLRVNGQVGKPKSDAQDAENWTLESLRAEMADKAQERFDVDHVDEPEQEVTVQLEMLGNTADYANLKALESVVLYDRVRVEDPEIGLNVQLSVSEVEFDITKLKITGIKLTNAPGSVARSVTGYNVTNGSIGAEKLKDGLADSIVRTAVDMIPDFVDPSERVTVIDSLTSSSATAALSANQGRVLNGLIPQVINNLTSDSTTAALSAAQGKALNTGKADKRTNQQLTASDDLNNCTDPAKNYGVSVSVAAANKPPASTSYSVIALETYYGIVQLAFGYNSATNNYIRVKYGSTWTSWAKLTTS